MEDVLLKVDKLIFPADFVILDFEEDKKIPIILGRPFLATGRTMIDVQKGELSMKVHDQKVTFNVFKEIKLPTVKEECFKVEQLQVLHAPPWKNNLDMPFDSLGVAELKDSQERFEPFVQETPTLERNQLSDHLSYSFLGAPPDKGLGYISDDVESGWMDIPVPTKGSSHVQQVVARTGVGDANYRRLMVMEAMHVIHRYVAEDLPHAFGTVVRDTGGGVDWPPDPPPEEGDSPDT